MYWIFYRKGMIQKEMPFLGSIKLSESDYEHEQQAMASFEREDVPPPHSARTLLIFRPN